MVSWLSEFLVIPLEYQFLVYLILGTIVVISVSLVYGLIISMISAVFNRR